MDLLIGDVFRNAARAVPGRVAAVHGDESLTFGEVDRRANQIARVLARSGVRRGDRVVVWSATALDTIPLFAALAKIGGVFAPLNAALTAEEVVATATTARPSLLVMDEPRAEAGAEIAAELGIRATTLTGIYEAFDGEDDGELEASGPNEDDPHVIFFTSGSTGRPKGVVLSHRVNFLRTHPGALLESRGPALCPYPLFHMAAWTITLQQWQARASVVFVESPDAATICREVERHRAERINCIPAIWRRILDHLATSGTGVDLSSVRFADTGTSATPLELLEAIAAALPSATLRVFYGSTEAGSVAMLEHSNVRRKPGSCGMPAPFTEVRLDATGELWVRSPVLFDGYFEDPEATALALVDGWYRTGDLADVDAGGYLTIVGRAGDVIRTGGESVTPAEVEAVIATHPAVADVAIVGVPDERWGEVVCAVVVPAQDAAPTLEALRAHCEGRLASFKQPRCLEIVESIPRTVATNQVRRRLLVEWLS